MNVSSVWARWQRKLAARTRKTQRAPQIGVEALESRELLSANALFLPASGELELDLDSSESVRIRSTGGNLVIEASTNGGLTYSAVNSVGTLPAADVLSINVLGGDDANTIDLRGVTKNEVDLNGMTVLVNGATVPAFTNLTSIVVDGANGDDSLFGSSDFGNSLLGGNGKDTIQGGNLGDTLNGGDGADTIFGDVVSTVAGNTPETQVVGGNDVINGGDGEDVIQGIGGNDTIDSGNGDDLVNGGTGNDSMIGANGQDSLIGNAGNDSLNGDGGFDLLYGDGDDPAVVGTGNDSLLGGEKSDTLFGGGGRDTLDGQSDDDYIGSLDAEISIVNGVSQVVSPETNDPLPVPALPSTLKASELPLPPAQLDPRAVMQLNSTGAALGTVTLSTGDGDGALDIVVDAYGAFGNGLRNNFPVPLTGFPPRTSASGAFFDPVGDSVDQQRSDVVFESELFFRNTVADGTPREELTAANPLLGAALPIISVFGEDGINELATSSFTMPFAPDLGVTLAQRVSPTTDLLGNRRGAILIQTYRITNNGTSPATFELVRFFDGDLRFDSPTNPMSQLDGGGQTSRTTTGEQILFESDNVVVSPTTARNFVGITAGVTQTTPANRYAIRAASGIPAGGTSLRGQIVSGTDNQSTGLNNIINDDAAGGLIPPNDFIATPYDVSLALRNEFISLAPDGMVEYTTHTIFGDNDVQNFIVQNLPPVTVDDVGLTQGSTIKIDVLGNDTDTDGIDYSTLRIEKQPRFGVASLELTVRDEDGNILLDANGNPRTGTPTGRILYTPFPGAVEIQGFDGTDEFIYSVEDLQGARTPADKTSGAATVRISVAVENVGDELIGASGSDSLVGNGGGDSTNGGIGSDHISAGAGNDLVVGGSGNDVIDGGVGDDTLRGNAGNDDICGDFGSDHIDGDAGDDLLRSVCEGVEPIGIYAESIDVEEPDLPDFVFVIDRSGSTVFTSATFGNLSVLNAEKQALRDFRTAFIASNANARVSIIAFDTTSQILDMDPTNGVSMTTTFTTDLDGNGRADFLDYLDDLAFLTPRGVTNYEAPLRDALLVFSDQTVAARPIPNLVNVAGAITTSAPVAVRGMGTSQGKGTLIFLTDGEPNFGLGNPPIASPNRPDPAVLNNGPFMVPIANLPPAFITVFGPAGINQPVTVANGTPQSIANLVLPVPPFAANQPPLTAPLFPLPYVTYADEVSSLVANGVRINAIQIDDGVVFGGALSEFVTAISEEATNVTTAATLSAVVQRSLPPVTTTTLPLAFSTGSDVPIVVDVEVTPGSTPFGATPNLPFTANVDYIPATPMGSTVGATPGSVRYSVTLNPGQLLTNLPIGQVLTDLIAESAETISVRISNPRPAKNPATNLPYVTNQPLILVNPNIVDSISGQPIPQSSLTVAVTIYDNGRLPAVAPPAINPVGLNFVTSDIDLGGLVVPSDPAQLPYFSNFGADAINGGDGNDTVQGDRGNDSINGGTGADSLFGGSGNDAILGGTGNDTLDGEAGNDTLDGQGGDDLLIDGVGSNTIVLGNGAGGNDTVDGSDGFNQISVFGTGNADTITVGQLNGSLIVTRAGATITGTTNMSVQGVEVNALGGDDTVTIQDLSAVLCAALLTINGGKGNDLITGQGSNLGLVRLALNGDNDKDPLNRGNGNDTIIGTNGADSIDGGAGNDAVNGQAGNDFIKGGDGNDTLAGALGHDTINGENGNDFLTGQAGDDSINGGTGSDTLRGFEGNDTLVGAAGDDLLNGMDGDDSILGGVGKDMISGGSGGDTIDGGRNDDTINGNAGNDKIRGDHGNDFIDAGSDIDTVNGGDGNDTIIATDGGDFLNGGDGNDRINAGGGNDIITGGDGNDSLLGGGGSDILLGGDGDDYIDGQGGIDTIAGNQGEIGRAHV